MTVVLRPASSKDGKWLDTWLPAVTASVGYDVPIDGKKQRAIIERDGERVGIAIWRQRAPSRDAAIIELIATLPERARRGSGMQAAALLEAQLRDGGVGAVYALAPAVHGIAMYFWIRLGYRPLLRADWPCEREGVAWLLRRLD